MTRRRAAILWFVVGCSAGGLIGHHGAAPTPGAPVMHPPSSATSTATPLASGLSRP
jgi:hypothetical protein